MPYNVFGDDIYFKQHIIKKPQINVMENTVPGMVLLDDVDLDGVLDLIVSHVSWKANYVHPYVAWYKGPEFREEHIIIDKESVGENSRVYRFVMYDVDGDGKRDLIGQGYQPYHNGNKWYRHPDDPTEKWLEYFDYGTDLVNGHDIMLCDIDNNGQMDLVLLDSHSGRIIVKPLPTGTAVRGRWDYYTISIGYGFTHYMTLYDVNGDGFQDIVIGKEEDGGDGIRWYEHPGYSKVKQIWKSHLEVDANFTKVFARDIDGDGDTDFIGTGEYFDFLSKLTVLARNLKEFLRLPVDSFFNNRDVGWYERVFDKQYIFHEFDKDDNGNDMIGGHNSELVDLDSDGDEDLLVGGVDTLDMVQKFRWYEKITHEGRIKWIEHQLGETSAKGWTPAHGSYCGDIAWGDIDNDGDIDIAYSGAGSGFLGWYENMSVDLFLE